MKHPTKAGFTLIEMIISTAITMLLASMITVAFIQIRRMINRAEARLRMHAQAQSIYLSLERSFSSLQQSCAMVAMTRKGGGPAEDGQVDLIFMRAKENRNDYWKNTMSSPSLAQNQLTWEEWRWLRTNHTLYASNSSIVSENTKFRKGRAFTIASSFTPSGSGFDYNGKSFVNAAQPRRWLDPTNPLSTLDDNIWFPGVTSVTPQIIPWTALTPRTWTPSLAPTTNDEGDYSDLQSNLSIECDQISEFAIEIVPHDPGLTTVQVDDRSSLIKVWQGVWLDGRLGQTLDPNGPVTTDPADQSGWNDTRAPQTFRKTSVAARPRTIRVAFTLTDPAKELSQSFSFSFATPALAALP